MSREVPAGRRLFVALPVPAAVGEAVAELVAGVRSAADPALRDVRWVRLDSLHVTLRFLGPTDPALEAAVVAAVDRTAARTASFEVAITGAGAFPSVARPRALWLGIDDGAEELAAAAAALGEELAGAGWVPDERPFRAHLTLARSDGVRAGPAVARRLIEAAAGFRQTFRVEAMGLYESQSGGGPARYLRLHEARLR